MVTELDDASLQMWSRDLQHQQLDRVPRRLACSQQLHPQPPPALMRVSGESNHISPYLQSGGRWPGEEKQEKAKAPECGLTGVSTLIYLAHLCNHFQPQPLRITAL